MQNRHRNSEAFKTDYEMVDTPEAVLAASMIDDMLEVLNEESRVDVDDSDWMEKDPSYLFEMSVSN